MDYTPLTIRPPRQCPRHNSEECHAIPLKALRPAPGLRGHGAMTVPSINVYENQHSARWCPSSSSRVQLVQISTTFHVWVDEWGLYRTSIHGIYTPLYHCLLVDFPYELCAFTVGLMNGGYIELVFMGFISTNVHITGGHHHLVGPMLTWFKITHDGSMYAIFVDPHLPSRNTPNVSINLPYMDPMGDMFSQVLNV